MTLNADVEYFKISAVNFKRLMQFNSQLSFRVLNMIGKRLQRAEDRLESLIFKDARERIIDFLKDNALQRGRKVGFETLFKHSLTQQDIANFTGTSRQTVTSVLNDLRKSNQIYFNRKSILIRDLANLA
jgi:CRP-like cAMP-binding protein